VGQKQDLKQMKSKQIVTLLSIIISYFINSAKKYSFQLIDINEYFDDEDRNNNSRILSMIFKKDKDNERTTTA
jgi:hypothetical protein